MNPSRIERIRKLFEQAIVLPVEEQTRFLDEHCPEEDIRKEVEELLGDTLDETGDFEQIADEAIRSPLSELRREQENGIQPANGGIPFDDPEKAGEQIGPYQLIRLVGEGGFGTVWEAQQESPVKRRVAIKFLKVGMATKEIIKRFEAERQALAMMGHANIAQVYDAGATDSGRSYFVMEYVEGMPLTQFCDKYQLSLKDRLHVFNLICGAIQHAHQKGIVHRDLKPNNILVHYEDEKTRLHRVLKIIDFGVAKVLRSTTSEHTMVTGLGQMIGTPAYMSPEQASFGIAIPDTRTDVYSLGILLYELLTGTLPFQSEDFKEASVMEIQRILQTKEPQRPSARLNALQNSNPEDLQPILDDRDTDFKTLHRSLQTDLDWVIIRCLEKDPERRYSTAHELLLDINRYLNNEALVAGPPSATYRISKLVKRHRRTALASTFVVLSFVIGFIGTILGLVQATKARLAEAEQRQLAEERTRELELVTDFQQSVFERLVPEQIGAEIFRSMLQSYEELLEIENIQEDERETRVTELRENLYQLNPTDLARQTFNDFVLKRSSQAITEQFADQPQVQAALRESLAESFRQIGLIQEAIDEKQRILELRSGMDAYILAESKLGLATTFLEGKFYSKASDILDPLLKEVAGQGFIDLIPRVRFKLGQTQYAQQIYELAEATLKQAHKEYVNALGKDHPTTLEAELEVIHAMRHFDYNLGYNSLQITGDLARIASTQEPLLKELLNKILNALDEDHPLTWNARLYWIESLAMRSWIPEENANNSVSYENGLICTEQLNLTYESQKRVLGANHPTTLNTFKTIVYLKRADKYWYDPEINKWCVLALKSILEEELEIWGENHHSVVETLSQIALLQHQYGFPEESHANTRRAIDILNRIYRSPSVEVADLHRMLADRILYDNWDAEAALKEAEKCLEIADAANAPQEKLKLYRAQYIRCLIAAGKLDEAESAAIEWNQNWQLSLIYDHQGKPNQKEEVDSEQVERFISNYQRGFPYRGFCGELVIYYKDKGNFEEAKHWLMESWECAQMTHDQDPRRFENLHWIPQDLASMGMLEDAREWAIKWEENKEDFIKVFPLIASRSPAFPYFEKNRYFGEEAYILYSAAIWHAIGDREKVDACIDEYFKFKEILENNADPELLAGYDKIIKSVYSPYWEYADYRIFADRGHWEEAEWLLMRGDQRFRFWMPMETRREYYQRRIQFYRDWHEADPDGGHLSEIPRWQEKIDAIDREYAKWRTEESQ